MAVGYPGRIFDNDLISVRDPRPIIGHNRYHGCWGEFTYYAPKTLDAKLTHDVVFTAEEGTSSYRGLINQVTVMQEKGWYQQIKLFPKH